MCGLLLPEGLIKTLLSMNCYFLINPNWKFPRSPLIYEWFKQTVMCIYMYHVIMTVQRSKILMHATTWINIHGILLSEKVQSKKCIFSVITFTKHLRNYKIIEMKNKLGVPVVERKVVEETG